jgi:hypothetical protein
MVTVMALWLPILLAAVIVFVVSSIFHTVLTHHDSDFDKVPAEDDVMEALRKANVPPGDYVMPRPSSKQEMKNPEFIERMKRGPVAFMTVFPSGQPSMGQSLVLWFVYCIVVGIFAAYICGRTLGPGAPYLSVFRFVGATAFMGYTLALWQNSIWYKRKWSATLKSTIDGLIYARVTAGTFGWLWPS